jgi:outer membrane protein TolC
MERAMTVTTSRFVLTFVFLLSISARLLADDGQPAADDPVQKAKQSVAAAQERLGQLKEFAESGAIPGRRLQQAEIDLAEAQINLAALEGNHEAVLDGLTALVEKHQRRWEHVQQLAESGAVPERSVLRARIDLAEARIRLEMQALLAVHQKEVARVEELAKLGAIPQSVADEARQNLDQTRGRIRLVKAPADGEAAATQVAASDAVKELLKERLATVAEIDRLVQAAYRAREASLDQVHQTKAALLAAQLDLAETKDDRIKVHQEMVTHAEEWTKIVAQMAKANEATATDVLKAKARLLEARIALERAKAGQ